LPPRPRVTSLIYASDCRRAAAHRRAAVAAMLPLLKASAVAWILAFTGFVLVHGRSSSGSAD
jgi:hypothetical protein